MVRGPAFASYMYAPERRLGGNMNDDDDDHHHDLPELESLSSNDEESNSSDDDDALGGRGWRRMVPCWGLTATNLCTTGGPVRL